MCLLSPDDGRTKPVPRKGHSESFEPADNKCLIRASEGKKKISTVVSLLQIVRFDVIKYRQLGFNSIVLSFQVTTKEVIKFQMVGWVGFSVWFRVFRWSFVWLQPLMKWAVNTPHSTSQAYSNLLRAHMDGLKKKDKKSKSKKTKATQWATDSLTQPWVPKLACAVWGEWERPTTPFWSFIPISPEAWESLFINPPTALLRRHCVAW